MDVRYLARDAPGGLRLGRSANRAEHALARNQAPRELTCDVHSDLCLRESLVPSFASIRLLRVQICYIDFWKPHFAN